MCQIELPVLFMMGDVFGKWTNRRLCCGCCCCSVLLFGRGRKQITQANDKLVRHDIAHTAASRASVTYQTPA